MTVSSNAFTAVQDTPFNFTGTHVYDPDAGDVQTATISVLQGTLHLLLDNSTITALGLTVTYDNTGPGTIITIVGPSGAVDAAAVDAALNAGFAYTSNPDYTGATDTLTIKDTDSFGGSSTQQVAITIGGNIAPVITSLAQTGAITVTGPPGSTTLDTVSGAVTFTDANFGDTHTVKVTGVTETKSGGGTLPGLATVKSWLTLGPPTDSTNGVIGSEAWTFSAPDNSFDYLAPGETLTLTYTLTVSDDYTGSSGPGTDTQNVTVIITGFSNEQVLNISTNVATLEVHSGTTLEIDSNVSNSGTLQADDGGTLELVANTITGGTIALNGSTAATTLQIEGTVTLAGGTTTLSDYAGNAIVSTHDEVTGAAKLVNKGNISGAGTIGDTTGGINLTLDNFGDIAATGVVNELILNTGTNVITNESGATLEAQSGATLEIDSNVTNTGATIKADTGGIVELVANTITGGTIALNGSTAATTLQIEGTVTLADGTNTTLSDYAGNAIVRYPRRSDRRRQAGQ